MKGWYRDNYRHSLAARGIKRFSFVLSDWSSERVNEEAGLMKKYIEREPKTLEEAESKKDVLQETEKDLRGVQSEAKVADIQAMRAELGLGVAAVGALTAATLQGEQMLQEASQEAEIFENNRPNPGVQIAIDDRAYDANILNKSDLVGNKFVAVSINSEDVGNPLDKSGDIVRNFGRSGVGKHYPMSSWDDMLLRLRAGLWE
jgi:hypothetical protein